MALTKVKLISDGVIVQGNLHSNHGITTAHIGEGSNLYYTDARVDTRVGNLNTGNLPEGSNLYYTDARADARIAAASTSDLSEGTNLYYTDARADARVALIVDSSPSTLNTLNELAAALGDDPNFATTTANSIGTKLPLAGGTMTGELINTSTAGITANSTSHAYLTVNSSAATTASWVNYKQGGTGRWLAGVEGGETKWQLYSSGTKFSVDTSGNATFAGEIRTSNRLAIKETNFGYSSSYKVIQVGESAAAKGISLGYDPSGNTSGSFSGNEILIPNNIRVLAPAANNSGYYGLIMLNSSNKVLLGGSNYLMESNYIMALDTATKNVGIGTASPTSKLHLRDPGSNSDVGIKIGNDSRDWNLKVMGSVSDSLQFFTHDNSNVMTILPSGNVGIGTSTPDNKLQVVAGNAQIQAWFGETSYTNAAVRIGGDNSPGGRLFLQYDGDNSYIDSYGGHGSTQRYRDFTVGARNIRFVTGNTSGSEKMRVAESGNIGIGTTTPEEKLVVIGDIGFGAGGYNGGVYANNNSSATGVDSNWGLEVQRTSNVDDYNTRLKYYPTNGSTRRAGIWNSRDDYFTIYSDDDHVPNVIIPSGELGIGTPSPAAKLHIKDSQDSSLYSGLKVERSANTTAAYLNAVGGALNLNTDSSMPLKFRIQNTSMQTISPDGGRAYAANASGLNMKEYGYNFTAANGVTVDLFENTSAHSDVTMVQISITAYHSSRSFFAGMGTFGGYGFHLTGAGNGLGNGGLTSTSTGTGTRKLQWSNTSGYNAVVRLYIQIRSEAGINVLNGTLSSL